MRRYRLSLCLALAVAALAYAGSKASAEPCNIKLGVPNNTRILLNHKKLAQCNGALGCKCVSCWNVDGSASSTCIPLAVAMPK